MARLTPYSCSKFIFVILTIVGALMMCPVSAPAQQGQDSAAFCPPPEADFGYPDTGCVPFEVQFKNLSTGQLYSWLWDFGDGTTSRVFDPKHTYTDTGFYTVSLTVTNSWGTDTETKKDYIMVITLPEADFDMTPESGSAPLTVDFTDKSKGDKFRPIDSWLWDFGDGSTSTDKDPPAHTYTSPGTYPVKLTVENMCGPDSYVDTVTVTEPEPPEADFGYPDSGCVPLEVQFEDLSTGKITSWLWSFGDGGTSTDQHPKHTYQDTGYYDVSLTVTGPGGSDTETKKDYITVITLPEADFDMTPESGKTPLTVDFTDKSKGDKFRPIDSWLWDFGDGSTSTAKDPPAHTYTSAGTYPVKLTVENMCGPDSYVDTVTVTEPEPPEADFGYPDTGCAPFYVEFKDLSTGDITSWAWSFGDGGTSTDQHPKHTYQDTGYYDVSLTVTGPGGSDTETKKDYIKVITVPIAKFTADKYNGEIPPPLEVTFKDHSVGNDFRPIDSWSWDFGDGSTSTAQNPTHTYTAVDTFPVTLTVTNVCGSDSYVDTIIVDEKLIGELSVLLFVDKPVASPLDMLTYTVQLRNDGDEAVDNVVVLDTIPGLTTFSNFIGGDGTYEYQPVENRVRWAAGTVGPFQTLELEFRVTIDADASDGAIIPDRAKIINADPPESVVQDEAEVTTVVQAMLVTLSKEASPFISNPGAIVTYTVRAKNEFGRLLVNTVLDDDLPIDHSYITGTAYVNAAPVNVTGTDPIRIEVGNIPVSDSATIEYQVRISLDADPSLIYENLATLIEDGGDGRSWGPVRAPTALQTPPLAIKKTVSQPSASPGDILRYLITVTNNSEITAENVTVDDTLPEGFVYVSGTGIIDESSSSDPTGSNPYHWTPGDLASGESVTIRYTVQISTRVGPGINENVAWAHADQFQSVRATARVNILPDILTGSIRGKVVVDCDGDGVPEMEFAPPGVDIFLDDGMQSKVNEKSMFYFSTVRPGEHTVTIDKRDLEGEYYLPPGQEASVFVHVHEMGESYVIFRICPAQPILDINKQVAMVPKARVTKTAVIDTTLITDTTGVMVDYEIDVESSGGVDPTLVRVIDSLPGETRLILREGSELVPADDQLKLHYEATVGKQKWQHTMNYSLEDLAPGVRQFLTNKVYLEGAPVAGVPEKAPLVSEPVEVSVGPFGLMPPSDMEFNIIGAYFETSKADLRPEAMPILTAIADSINKYDSVHVRAEGHCDYRRIHTRQFPSNWELSDARAQSVLNWLMENAELDSAQVEYEGYAATRPVDTGHTPEAWQRNRRVEVFIKGIRGRLADLSAITAERWEGSSILELSPINWDTIAVAGDEALDPILRNTWEIRLVIRNIGPKAAQEALLTDIIPAGAEYVEGSCYIDGQSASPEAEAPDKLNIRLGRIDPDQQVTIAYRIRALDEERMPTGEGSASVKVTDPEVETDYRSNPVKFGE